MGISIRAYAKHRGVSHTAVSKAIKAGRITREADGTIDPKKADKDWALNTRPKLNTAQQEDTSYQKARSAYDAVTIKIDQLKLQKAREELIDIDKANKHMFTLSRQLRDSKQIWPSRIASQMAAELGVDQHQLHTCLEQAIDIFLMELVDCVQVTHAALEQTFQEAIKPNEQLLLSAWSDKYRILSSKSSAEPGRWRTSRTPYLKEIMDCLSTTSPVERVVFMKGSQIGGTEVGLCWLGYVIHMMPGPMMMVAPTVELAKRHSKQRLDPQFELMPVLKERVKCVALLRMRFGRRDPSAPFALARRLYHAAAVRVTGATCTSHTAHRLSHDSTPA